MNRNRKQRRCGHDLEVFSNASAESNKQLNSLDRKPGMHPDIRRKTTQYGEQLKAKQTLRFYYGVSEKQFFRTYKEADRRKGSTVENLLSLLESRLDNIVYRMGFASTRAEARQLVSHKSIAVNGVTVNIKSYLVKVGDKVSVKEKAKKQLRIKSALDMRDKDSIDWVNVDDNDLSGTYTKVPTSEELPQFFSVNSVIELYSK